MKIRSIWKIGSSIALLLLSIFRFEVAAAMPSREDDIQKYIALFSSATPIEQKQASAELAWQGLSDPRLFDVVEKKLLESYKSANDHNDADYAAWLCKALGFSGQEKYRVTLQEVAKNGASRSLRKYAELALDQLGLYAKWNPIIADQAQDMAGKSSDINRFANMLRSGDKGLQELAARRIIEQPIRDTELLNLLQKTVEPDIAKNWTSDDDVKAVAYMLKALAVSGQPQYLATVQTAAGSAVNKKVRKYAEGYVKNSGR